MAPEEKTVPVLYHGTTAEFAARLLAEGWKPRSGSPGGNCGQTRFLYLTKTHSGMPRRRGRTRYSNYGTVPMDWLEVDPEDGVADTVEEELALKHGLPGYVVLKHPVGPERFAECPKPPRPR